MDKGGAQTYDFGLMAFEGQSNLDRTLSRLKALLQSVKDPLTDDWDPIELGLLVAKMEYEDLDLEKQFEQFQALVADIAKDLTRAASLREQTAHVVRAFSDVLAFGGDKNNYYNPKNSYLNDVILRRKGIPISLSLVFMGLCRGVGLRAVGISFPGHFLVRMVASEGHFEMSTSREKVEDWRTQWFIDCFDAGKFMTIQDCEARLMEWTRGVIPFGPDVLTVAHPVEILSRMLRNLKAIFAEKEDLPRLYWVLTALKELCPQDSAEAVKDRGFLLARMGRFSAALQDLRYFLTVSKDIQKIQHVERIIRHFETQSDQTN